MATGLNSFGIFARTALLIVLPFLITSPASFAVDTSILNPQPNFAGVAGGGVTASAGACFLDDLTGTGGATGGASQLNLGIKTKASAKDATGCGATAVPDSSSLTCDSPDLQDGNGVFSQEKFEKKLESLSLLDGKPPVSTETKKSPEGSLVCEKNEFASIQKEMSCVQNQGQLLAQQIGSLSQIYQQNITRFGTDDQAYKQREGDRQNQLDAIQKLLGGNKNSGTKGLLGEQADLQKLVNDTMPQDIAASLAQSKTVANQRAIILQNVQKHTMSLTGDCFKSNPKAGYKCTPGGADLSPENYIVCMYGKYAHVKNGQYVQGALADSNATSAQNTLQGILDQMTSQTALSYSTPTDPNSASATALKPSYGNTIQDVINNFVSKTASMTVNGISVSTTITNELQSCYLAAQAEVASERTDPSSAISQAQFQQTQSETALKAAFDQKLEAYSQKWTEAMGVLSAQNLPLNLSNCKSQDITYEGNCLTDVQTQLTSLLKGDATQTPFTMNVPGQFADTTIPAASLQCRGINGCVTQLQAVNDQVTQAKTTLTTQRKAYETQARQSTDKFTQQVAALLSNQSAQLRKQLTSVNSKLQGLGVSGNISFPNIQGAKMEYETNDDGSQGLPKMPDDIMKLIGGKVTPPLMDLTDNSGNDSSGIAEGVKKVNENLQKVSTVRSKWEAKASECKQSDVKSLYKSAVQNITQCSNVCDALKSANKNRDDATDAWEKAKNKQSDDQKILEALQKESPPDPAKIKAAQDQVKFDSDLAQSAATAYQSTSKDTDKSKYYSSSTMLSSTLTAVQDALCKNPGSDDPEENSSADDDSDDEGSGKHKKVSNGCVRLSGSASQTLQASETTDLVSALTTGCSGATSDAINGAIDCNEIKTGASGKSAPGSNARGSNSPSSSDRPE